MRTPREQVDKPQEHRHHIRFLIEFKISSYQDSNIIQFCQPALANQPQSTNTANHWHRPLIPQDLQTNPSLSDQTPGPSSILSNMYLRKRDYQTSIDYNVDKRCLLTLPACYLPQAIQFALKPPQTFFSHLCSPSSHTPPECSPCAALSSSYVSPVSILSRSLGTELSPRRASHVFSVQVPLSGRPLHA